MTGQTSPRVIAAIPDDGMYLVALDESWGRILAATDSAAPPRSRSAPSW